MTRAGLLAAALFLLAAACAPRSTPTINLTLPPLPAVTVTVTPSPPPTDIPSPDCFRPPTGSSLIGPTCVTAVTSITVDDQVADSVIPKSLLKAAADSWGVPFTYNGPAACETSPTGTDVFCMVSQSHGMGVGLPASWLGGTYTNGQGSILSPRLIGMSASEIQEVVCHEIGNALGVPEHGPGIYDCMATPINGALNPPSR